MSDISELKPHSRHGNGYGVTFWCGGSASNEEGATSATVYTGVPGMPWPEVYFKLPDERLQMENLERMLQKAFAAGDAHARQEIRDALGVPRR